jgi:hypothetical protein
MITFQTVGFAERAIARPLVLIAMACLAIGATSSASAQNLIVNGTFDAPVVPNAGFEVYTPASGSLSGWGVQGTEVAIVGSSFVEYGVAFVAQSGTQWMDLSGLAAPNTTNGIVQSVATSVGEQYQLSFYLGSAYNGSGPYLSPTLDLSIDGGTRVSYTNSNIVTNGQMNWQMFTTSFTATSTLTSVGFYYGATGSAVWAVGLDSVSLTVVPAPGAIAAIAGGVVLGGRRRARAS